MTTKLTPYKGVDVYVGNDGRFTAWIDEEPIEASSLDGLKKKIDGAAKAVRKWKVPVWLVELKGTDPLGGTARLERRPFVWAGLNFHTGLHRCKDPETGKAVDVHDRWGSTKENADLQVFVPRSGDVLEASELQGAIDELAAAQETLQDAVAKLKYAGVEVLHSYNADVEEEREIAVKLDGMSS